MMCCAFDAQTCNAILPVSYTLLQHQHDHTATKDMDIEYLLIIA